MESASDYLTTRKCIFVNKIELFEHMLFVGSSVCVAVLTNNVNVLNPTDFLVIIRIIRNFFLHPNKINAKQTSAFIFGNFPTCAPSEEPKSAGAVAQSDQNLYYTYFG